VLVDRLRMSHRIRQLEDSLGEVRRLRRLLPICMDCKSIRTSDGEWIPIEKHLWTTEGAETSHGICPACLGKRAQECE